MRNPARTSAWSSTSTTRITRSLPDAPRSRRQPAATRKPPPRPRRRPASGPAEQRRPAPACRSARARRRPPAACGAPAVVARPAVERRSRHAVAHLARRPCAGPACLTDVGQRLLHDPVRRQRRRPVGSAAACPSTVRSTGSPAARTCATRLVDLRQARLRRALARPSPSTRSTPSSRRISASACRPVSADRVSACRPAGSASSVVRARRRPGRPSPSRCGRPRRAARGRSGRARAAAATWPAPRARARPRRPLLQILQIAAAGVGVDARDPDRDDEHRGAGEAEEVGIRRDLPEGEEESQLGHQGPLDRPARWTADTTPYMAMSTARLKKRGGTPKSHWPKLTSETIANTVRGRWRCQSSGTLSSSPSPRNPGNPRPEPPQGALSSTVTSHMF